MTYLMSDIDRNFWTTIVGCIAVIVIVLLAHTNIRKGVSIRLLRNISAQYVITQVKLKSILFAQSCFISLDEHDKIIWGNKKTEKFFGLDEEDLKGKKMDKIISAKYLNEFETFKKNHSAENDDTHLEAEAIRNNGLLFPVEITISKWYDDDEKKFVRYTIEIRDISHRKRTEETKRIGFAEINKQNSLCNMAQRILKAGAWSWDMSNDNVEYDKEFAKYFWLAPGEAVKAKDLMDKVFIDDREAVNNAMLTAGEKGIGYNVTYRIVQKNFRKDLVRCVAEPVLSENGKLIRLNGAIQLIEENVI